MANSVAKRPDITVSTDDLERLEGLLGEMRSGAPIFHPINREALALEPLAYGLCDHTVVFNQQDSHFRSRVQRSS